MSSKLPKDLVLLSEEETFELVNNVSLFFIYFKLSFKMFFDFRYFDFMLKSIYNILNTCKLFLFLQFVFYNNLFTE